MKGEFANKPIHAYPDYNSDERFQVAVDFSKENVASILSQVQDEKMGAHTNFQVVLVMDRLKSSRILTNYEATYGKLIWVERDTVL